MRTIQLHAAVQRLTLVKRAQGRSSSQTVDRSCMSLLIYITRGEMIAAIPYRWSTTICEVWVGIPNKAADCTCLLHSLVDYPLDDTLGTCTVGYLGLVHGGPVHLSSPRINVLSVEADNTESLLASKMSTMNWRYLRRGSSFGANRTSFTAPL